MSRMHWLPFVAGWLLCSAAVLLPDGAGVDQAPFLSLPGLALVIVALFWQQRDHRKRWLELLDEEDRRFREVLRRLHEEGRDPDG